MRFAFANWRAPIFAPQIVIKNASSDALANLRRSKNLARTIILADEFTARHNERAAEALEEDKSGVFGISGKL